jgi:PAS domain S-box-containing protein
MPRACLPLNERERLGALIECSVLDTEPERVFDDLTSLAARLCEAPIALVSLLDSERQWFKSAHGIGAKETHRDSAFCAHAILGTEPLIVTNALTDPRTCDNALVLEAPYIRFYAGVPLQTADGFALGTLCVIDTKPRQISDQQINDLQSLALQVTSQLELRRLNRSLTSSQAQLKEVHDRLHQIAAQVPGVVYQFELRADGTSCFPFASEGIREIYRVSPEDVRHDAAKIFNILHPDDYSAVVESIQRSANDLTRWRHEYRVRFSDGAVRWCFGNAAPCRQADGSVRWHGYIMDSTDQVNAREELLFSRSRMQAVVEGSTHVSIIASDVNGLITVFNSGAEQMLGYSASEMIGLQTPAIFHCQEEVKRRSQELSLEFGYSIEGFETFVHRARHGGHSESDWNYIRKDGSRLIVRLVVTATRDRHNAIDGFIGIATNITDSRNAAEVLRFERERLDMALTGGELGTWDWNIQTGEEIWDSRWASLLGEQLADLDPHIDTFVKRVHPEDISDVQTRAQNHFDGLSPIFEAEFRVLQKTGEWRWVQSRGRLMQRDEDGNPRRMLGTMADISARKEAEKQLIAARKSADNANRSKSEFLANMSHEIRTPVTSILGYSELLSSPGLNAEEMNSHVSTIQSSAHHLLTIINDVLDLSKIEAGKMTLEFRQVFPVQLIAEVLSSLEPQALAKNLIIKAQSIGPIPRVIVSDAVRLRQILINLLGNAIKFTDSGSVNLTVRIAPKSADGIDRLAFDVTDTGIGMDPDQLAGLFQPFMQADASTTRRFGGTGLGLSICRRMARLLDGDISVTSELGLGSTFSVSVAMGSLGEAELLESASFQLAASDAGLEKVVAGDLRLNGRFLLAEDNPVNRWFLETILRRAGATIDVAENGVSVLEKVSASMERNGDSDSSIRGYDLILMDMQMPVLDGYEATRRLREQGYKGPILALTAHAMAEDRKKCLEAGCSDYATKPIAKSQLLKLCHKWTQLSVPQRLGLAGSENV